VRALYIPGRDDPEYAAGALPRERSPEAEEQAQNLRDALVLPEMQPDRMTDAERVHREQVLDRRMERMSVAERIQLEIGLTARQRSLHSFDHDPLTFAHLDFSVASAAGYDAYPGADFQRGADNFGPITPPQPVGPPRSPGRNWYSR
jgi:hypothetical protein